MLNYQAINNKEQNPISQFKLDTIRRIITAVTCQHQLTVGDNKIQKYILVSDININYQHSARECSMVIDFQEKRK